MGRGFTGFLKVFFWVFRVFLEGLEPEIVVWRSVRPPVLYAVVCNCKFVRRSGRVEGVCLGMGRVGERSCPSSSTVFEQLCRKWGCGH